MAGRPITIRSNSRNVVADLRTVLAPYRSGERSLPADLCEQDETWLWVPNGLEQRDEIKPLWTDERDIAAVILFGDWMGRVHGIMPEAVYVISDGGDTSKIGVSSSPGNRLAQIQSTNPRPLQIKALCWTDRRPRVIERISLEMLERRGRRLVGEWTDVDSSTALTMIFDAAAECGSRLTPAAGLLGGYLSLLLPDYLDIAEDPAESEAAEHFRDVVAGGRLGRTFGTIR